jgi:hypothetical protein
MKAILIDAKNREVKEVQITGDLESWYETIGCGMVECALYFNEHDSIMVDEEGLFNENCDEFFFVNGGHQPFAGNGLVVGTDDTGEAVDTKIALNEVKSKVKFMDRFDAYLWAKQQKS